MRIPPGGELGAASATGRSGERERAPSPSPRRGAVFSPGGVVSASVLGASALGRTRGRVALPLLRRRSDGGPDPPGGGLRAASARAGRSGERAGAIAAPATDGCLFLWVGIIFAAPPASPGSAPRRTCTRAVSDGQSRPLEKGAQSVARCKPRSRALNAAGGGGGAGPLSRR